MSDFRKRKVKTLFAYFDFDKDGVMSKDDFLRSAARFASFQKADEQMVEHLKTQFVNVWEQYFRYSEKKEQHTLDEFADAIAKQRYDPDLIKSETASLRACFDMMDLNCDGYLDEGEFERVYTQFGADDAPFAKEVFKAMDTNGDGKLSHEEYLNAYFDFLFSEDEKSPNTYFFGPLVD